MAVAKDGRLAASSTAAGPAFEGMNIACGMRAASGTVDSFTVNDDGECAYTTIGGGKNGPAAGICGSGLLDIAGELVRTGVIDRSGRFVPPDKGGYPARLKERMGQADGKNAFFITDGVYLDQKDVRQIQLAKGAIRCGIEMLLSRFGARSGDVDAVIIAGSFGYHLNERSLLDIGLLPPPRAACSSPAYGADKGSLYVSATPPARAGKVSFAGNTSLSGAEAFLLNASFRQKMEEAVARVENVELAHDAGFERMFVKYMGF
jgi:uncharacterized 2Fe-2S/4Fe-4S cluster protein (DUF4445 family)